MRAGRGVMAKKKKSTVAAKKNAKLVAKKDTKAVVKTVAANKSVAKAAARKKGAKAAPNKKSAKVVVVVLSPKQSKAARAVLGWTQQDLAERAKVGESAIAEFEKGKKQLEKTSFEAIVSEFKSAGIRFMEGNVQGLFSSATQSPTLGRGAPLQMISATDLVQWAASQDAKAVFPELIQRLVLATVGNVPKRLQFPSGDSVQQPGWDGICEQKVTKQSAWLPFGISGWELGAQETSLRSKAEDDFRKRKKDSLGLPKTRTTFVFATLRRWKAGAEWAREKRNQAVWKNVCILDADDLAAWIALYPQVGSWLAARLGKPISAGQPLEMFWHEWSLSTEWTMSTELVLGGRDRDAVELLKWLYDKPTVRSVQGDSAGEGIAFLYAAIGMLPDQYKKSISSRCIVAPSPEAARTLGNSSSRLVIIMESSEPGLASRLVEQGHQVLVAYGSRVGTSDVVSVLGRPSFEPFQESLEEMGISQVRAQALTRDCARRLSILRRLIPSTAGAKTPEWAETDEGRRLLPALLGGAWDEDSPADRTVLEGLSGESFDAFCARCPNWVDHPDAPLRHAGKAWKIASPYDAWFRLARLISKSDLERFVEAARAVLSDEDPRFEMDAGDRWLAGIRGQLPRYSSWLTSGITETLLLLAIFGNEVRAVPNASQYADMVVRELLGNADSRRWWSLSSELNTLAEASPEVFMGAIEGSLVRDDKSVMVLFKEDDGPLMGRAYHSHLLWGLETLAWSSMHLSRVAEILARLATLDPGGRYANRPKASLRSIFLLWLPQTNATFAERFKVLDRLRKVAPDVTWELMLNIFPKGYDTSTYNPRPKWRDFEVPQPEVVTNLMLWEGTNALAVRLIADAGANADRWKTLIEHLPEFPPDWKKKAWTRLEALATEITRDEQRIMIWATLRFLVSRHRSFPEAKWALATDQISEIENVYHKFSPEDPILQCSWLFSSDAPLMDGTPAADFEKRDQRLSELRRNALALLLQQSGPKSLSRLIENAKDPFLVGVAYVQQAAAPEAPMQRLEEFVESDALSTQQFVRGVVAAGNYHHGWQWAQALIAKADTARWSQSAVVRILLALPHSREVWRVAESRGESTRALYWKSAAFFPRNESSEDKLYAIDQMLAAGRAAHVVEMIAGSTKDVPTGKIVEVLSAAAKSEWPGRGNDVVMFQWGVGQLLKALEETGTVEELVVAQLEWLYLALLEHSERAPIVLHRSMATDPSFFVQVVSAAFRPRAEDASKDQELTDQERALASHAYRLLHSWRTVPGVKDSHVDGDALRAWVNEAHRLATEARRGKVGDHYIGQVLCFAPVGSDGVWPHEAVRNVIEELRNGDIEQGISIGVHNKMGVTSRGIFEGGTIERSSAKKYSEWSGALKLEWPKTSALLKEIARGFESSARFHDEQAERTDWGG